MLEGLDRQQHDGRVHRLAGGWTVRKAAEKRGLTEDEYQRVVARVGGEVPNFLDAPFTPLEGPLEAGVGPYGSRTRFSSVVNTNIIRYRRSDVPRFGTRGLIGK